MDHIRDMKVYFYLHCNIALKMIRIPEFEIENSLSLLLRPGTLYAFLNYTKTLGH